MSASESRVWVTRKRLKPRRCRCSGECRCRVRYSYALRWRDPDSGKWRSRAVGTDRKAADRQAAVLEEKLHQGEPTGLRSITWDAFVTEHVGRISGKRNAVEAKRTLDEFGSMFNAPPNRVTFQMVESYVEALEAKGNSQATRLKKLRYVRAAFNKAVRRGYIARNPMEGWTWERERQREIRVISDAEETALLEAAEKLYGSQWRTFIFVALRLGARRGELLALGWNRVDFDNSTASFRDTKDKKDRRVPMDSDVADVLRRLQAQTLQQGGPFTGMADNMSREWGRIRKRAGIEDVTIHDCRRSFVSRLLRAGVPLATVQRMAGHSNVGTTTKYYAQVNDGDMRAAVEKLQQVTAG